MVGSSSALVVSASQGLNRPYRLWNFARYMDATSASRKMFWERASAEKRAEVAAELSKLPERSEVVQEARLDFGAERWGLIAGAGAVADAAVVVEPDEEDEVL